MLRTGVADLRTKHVLTVLAALRTRELNRDRGDPRPGRGLGVDRHALEPHPVRPGTKDPVSSGLQIRGVPVPGGKSRIGIPA